jgi:hypothetical protein
VLPFSSLIAYSDQQREVGCSDLYNMTEAIKAQGEVYQAPQSTGLPANSDAAQPSHKEDKVIPQDG